MTHSDEDEHGDRGEPDSLARQPTASACRLARGPEARLPCRGGNDVVVDVPALLTDARSGLGLPQARDLLPQRRQL